MADAQDESVRERLMRTETIFGCVGVAFCLALRDISQFAGISAISGNPTAQYTLALARAFVLVLILGWLVFSKRRQRQVVADSTWFIMGVLVAAVLQTVGLFLLITVDDSAVDLTACFLVGCGQSLLVCQWAIWLFRRTPYEFLCITALSLAVAGGMEMVIAFMQTDAKTALAIAGPVVTALCAAVCSSRGSMPTYKVYKRSERMRVDAQFVLFLVLMALYSLVARQLTDAWMFQSNGYSIGLFMFCGGIGTALCSLIALLALYVGRQLRNVGAYVMFIVPVVVAATYLSSFLQAQYSAAYVVPLFVLRKSIFLFSLLYATRFASERDRLISFAASLFCVEAGNFLQTALGSLSDSLGGGSDLLMSLVFTASIVAVCVIPLFIIVPSLSKAMRNTSPAPSSVERKQQARTRALDEMQQEFGLTKREREVLGYLAAGRNAEHIAKELYIAQSTAKSHIAHIYQKTGMNAQQKIMDDVDRRAKADAPKS